MPRVRKKSAPLPSRISKSARAAMARTARARAAIDAAIVGVVVEGGPPEIGPCRNLDLAEVTRRYRERAA
jgi:hypothetical protein